MMVEIKPRRSVLYMPGINRRAMEKAKTLSVDAIILDLEDAVSPDAKAEARNLVCAQVKGGGYGYREVVIRVNGESTPWHEDDISAAMKARPDAILVPKVNDAAMVMRCLERIRRGGKGIPIWVMIETPAGVANVDEIAAVTGVETLVMGTSDLLKELRAVETRSREALLYALSRTVLAARRHDRIVLDGVSPNLHDSHAFEAVCVQGATLGFDGKTLIHPTQIEPANRIFGPEDGEVEHARRVIATWEEAEADGRGIAVLDGHMIENLHAEQARRVVKFSEVIAMRQDAGVDQVG